MSRKRYDAGQESKFRQRIRAGNTRAVVSETFSDLSALSIISVPVIMVDPTFDTGIDGKMATLHRDTPSGVVGGIRGEISLDWRIDSYDRRDHTRA